MTPTKTRPHKPMLAEWTSEILSLSLSLSEDQHVQNSQAFRTAELCSPLSNHGLARLNDAISCAAMSRHI